MPRRENDNPIPGNLGEWIATTTQPNPMPGAFAEFKVIGKRAHYTDVREIPRRSSEHKGSLKAGKSKRVE